MVLPSFSDDSQWLSVSPSQSLLLSERSKAVLLDPLLSGYYHLFVGDLLLLEPVGNFDLFRLGSRWVAYVDVVGNIRTVYEMQKCYIIEVDDGTGCIECTVWRDTSCLKPPNISRHVVSSTSVEQERICDQLLRMARSQRPAHGNSPLRLGQMIHLRGRLGRYRGKVRLNATFSRIVTEPRELFSQMLHRKKLKSAVYFCPYDPEHIGKSLLKSLSVNCAETVLEDARRILLEDNLHTFTKWDLCLHSRLIQLLSTAPHPVAFDDAESPYLTTNSCVPERSLAQTVHRLVDGLIERLQSEGWIYPTGEPMGPTCSFHIVSGDRLLVECVYDVIRNHDNTLVESGASIRSILDKVRHRPDGDWAQLSWSAVRRILEDLEANSRIYQVGQYHYRIA